MAKALRWLQDNRAMAQGEGPSICHYDFHPMNALIDDGGHVSVTDWEGAGVDDRLRYWMALHAADGWAESAQLLAGTIDRHTRTDTREGPAAVVGPAMAKLFHRLVPEA